MRWTVGILASEKQNLSDYSLEYSTALLLNISLRSQGKEKFEEIKHSVLNLLGELLDHESSDLRSFVNGTLYSLFARPGIRSLAREMGFEDRLRQLSLGADPQLRRRCEYILELLLSDAADTNLSELNEDDNDFDLIEEEEGLEEDENEVPDEAGWKVSGEQLLKDFAYEGKELEAQMQLVSAMLEDTINQSKLEMTRNPLRLSDNGDLMQRPSAPFLLSVK